MDSGLEHVMDLFQSAIEGDEDGIMDYVNNGHDIDELMEFDGYVGEVSALMLASQNGQFDTVKLLLKYEADISHITQFYTRALVLASRKKISHTLSLLAASGLYKGVKVKDEKMRHHEDIINCVQSEQFDKLNCLISNSSSQITAYNQGESTLNFLILSGCSTSHLRHLMDNVEVDVNGYDSRGFTPLISAVIAGDLKSIDFLIGKGADVNQREKISSVEDFECRWVKSEVETDDDDDDDSDIQNVSVLDSDDKSPLMYAVWIGNLEVVKRLLAIENVHIDCFDSQRRTALVHAVYAGNLDIVDELLRHKANVNFEDCNTGEPVLFQAVNAGCEENIVKSLLNAGANKKMVDYRGNTALLHAVTMGRAGVLKVFLSEGGFDIDYVMVSHFGQLSALMIALDYKHFDCMKLLIEYGADVSLDNVSGTTVFDLAAHFCDVDIVKLLLESKKGSKYELTTKKSLFFAVHNEDSGVLKLLLPYFKDNIDVLDDRGMTPLMCASRTENINLLLENGADINIKSPDGNTAVIWTLIRDDLDCFKLLVQAGADINYVPCDYDTLLVKAAVKDDIGFLEILLQQGTQQVNEVSKYSGITPLISAVDHKRKENIRLLLDYGADLNLSDDTDDSTPIMHAINCHWPEGLKFLLEEGADPNLVDMHGETVWLGAMDSWECLKILLEDGSVLDRDKRSLSVKKVHLECGIYLAHVWDVKRLLLLFEYGIFDWTWYTSYSQIDKIAYAAVNTKNNSPVLFETSGEMSTLLREALLGKACSTVRYLLANLFLTMEDYRACVSDSQFKQRMKTEEYQIPEVVSIFNRISSQPWRLDTFSFLTISSSLSSSSESNQSSGMSRSEQVDSLPLPEMFKTRFKFENVVRNLCPGSWETIGVKPNGLEDDLLAVFKPLYPYQQLLSKCEEDCTSCLGCGYTIS